MIVEEHHAKARTQHIRQNREQSRNRRLNPRRPLNRRAAAPGSERSSRTRTYATGKPVQSVWQYSYASYNFQGFFAYVNDPNLKNAYYRTVNNQV